MTGMITMDSQIIEMVAAAAAQRAAQEITIEVRAEVADQFTSLKDAMKTELKSEFNAYFGEMKPSHHIIQHDRLHRFVKWYDNFTESLATKVMTGVVIAGALVIGLLWVGGKALGL